MSGICQPSHTKWFEAAQKNDLPIARKLLDQSHGIRDIRKTDKEASIFSDFTALLYATLNDHSDLTQLLIPLEYNFPTT